MTGTRHTPPIPLPQVPRTVHKQGHRPTKGAWVQYGKFCYTATGVDSWSHDAWGGYHGARGGIELGVMRAE